MKKFVLLPHHKFENFKEFELDKSKPKSTSINSNDIEITSPEQNLSSANLNNSFSTEINSEKVPTSTDLINHLKVNESREFFLITSRDTSLIDENKLLSSNSESTKPKNQSSVTFATEINSSKPPPGIPEITEFEQQGQGLNKCSWKSAWKEIF